MKRWTLLITLGTAAWVCAAASDTLTDDDARWREKIGFNPQVHGSVPNSSDAEIFARVPFAYYPSSNELEVVFDLAAAIKLLPKEAPAAKPDAKEVEIAVLPASAAADAPLAGSKTLALDGKGRAHTIFRLPTLPEGEYRVDYRFGGTTLRSSRTFRIAKYPFMGNNLGKGHAVFAPFTPVTVKGAVAGVVGRSYRLNALGLFDSVTALGRELLAEPMRLVGETDQGTITWKAVQVKGAALYPDLATFTCRSTSAIGVLDATVAIEEDGCAKIDWQLTPTTPAATVKSLTLEIALRESEVPLCHLVGMNSMRHNYAGTVPRGGTINWFNQSWRPARFEVEPFAGSTPASYQVWEAKQQMHWGSQRWNFAPYVWLGAEERGLAWFGDDIEGYSSDGKTSIQRLFIEPGKVILRVAIISMPTVLDQPRHLTFGLQASPTKPMPADWRAHPIPGGGGMSVVVWGGFNCADKYPFKQEWSLVDKIMEGRSTHKVDTAWFTEFANSNGLEKAQANGQPWLQSVQHFAGVEAGKSAGEGTTVYFEEHQTSGSYPETWTFGDEWGDTSFSRYRYPDWPGKTWGPEIRSANPESYRDFAVYMANEWMRRGIGIYYDNTFPKLDYNRQHFAGRSINWMGSIWAHRDYYRRVWKRSRELMASGESPLRLHTVGHVTNCQILPYTTWWDATLGVEQPGQWISEPRPTVEASKKAFDEWGFAIVGPPTKGAPGNALPFPPDYLRAMEMGRMAGLVSHYRHLLRSEDAVGGLGIGFGATSQGSDPAIRAHRLLSDAGMGLVHEMRGGDSGWDQPEVAALRRAFASFGYGSPNVTVYNYWDEKPFASVSPESVKWLAMTREGDPTGLILLQSYQPAAVIAQVRFPGAKALIDQRTRESFAVDKDGTVAIPLSEDYGTRLLFVQTNPASQHLIARSAATVLADDFEFGLGGSLRIKGGGFTVVEDAAESGNHVLRISPGHPSQNTLSPLGIDLPGDCNWSFRFRIPALADKHGDSGLLALGFRSTDKGCYMLSLNLSRKGNAPAAWSLGAPIYVLPGGKNEGYQTPESRSGISAPVDAAWHQMRITTTGPRHRISIDGQEVFAGSDDRLLKGGFTLAPGWGFNSALLPFLEIDDLMVETVKP